MLYFNKNVKAHREREGREREKEEGLEQQSQAPDS
jgi:hypothetical protein